MRQITKPSAEPVQRELEESDNVISQCHALLVPGMCRSGSKPLHQGTEVSSCLIY